MSTDPADGEAGPTPGPGTARIRIPWSAGAGVLAVVAGLGAGELAAGLVSRGPSPVVAVAAWIIDAAPRWVVDLGIATFGRDDKTALVISVVAATALVGAGVGVVSARRPALGIAALVGLGAVATVAAISRPDSAAWLAAAVTGPATAAAVVVLVAMLALANDAPGPDEGSDPAERSVASAGGIRRRAVLGLAGAVVAGAALSAGAGRLLARRAQDAALRVRRSLPRPASPAPPPPPASSFVGITGLTPLITPNPSFYRIDTALTVPVVDVRDWRLRVRGLVDRPLEFSYDQLLALPLVERDVTIACVSNPVGGELVGTARWLGVPLADLLDRAGVAPEAAQIVGRSTDGFTTAFPTAAVSDGRTALVAVGMNGEPLPSAHGFPARLVVAGLYGYVSATKWLTDLELTTAEAFDPYWVRRGWAKQAPIKIQSRIDVPRPYALLRPGPVTIAGVAWAPTRGIAGVEVQVDGGPWSAAELATALGDESWRQWRWRWQAAPGRHLLAVRATDASGVTQDAADHGSFPDGATGHHTVAVTVRGR